MVEAVLRLKIRGLEFRVVVPGCTGDQDPGTQTIVKDCESTVHMGLPVRCTAFLRDGL